MNVQLFDVNTPLFFFNDQRLRYSLNQIRSLLEEGIATTPDTPVRIVEAAFRAEDLVKHVAPVLSDFMLSEENEGAANWGDLGDSKRIERSNGLDATQGIASDSNRMPVTIPENQI